MRFEGKQLREEFKAAFGKDVSEMTARELWFITKFAKHVRMRCRNNAAFNNYMNRNFAPAQFQDVEKHRADGSSYKGLKIVDSKQNAADDADGEE